MPNGHQKMRRVVVESPYAGDIAKNTRYLLAAMRDCLKRGESPFASHALYAVSGVLDEVVLLEKELGFAAGLAWAEVADATVVYIDYGISPGMKRGISHAHDHARPVEYRRLDGQWEG
jgi:hypothetical protein